MRMIRGVLFDFDGVIVQSEPLHMRTFMEILAPYGVHVSQDRWYREFAGTGSRSIFERLAREYKVPDPIDELVERRKILYEKYVRSGMLNTTIGIRDFLASLKKERIKRAIVSGSHRTNVELALSIFGLGEFFDIIVSGDDTEFRKPDPGAFLYAAKKIGLTPAECVVIEDSVAGAEAARRGGMKLIAVKSPALHQLGRYDLAIDDFLDFDVKTLQEI